MFGIISDRYECPPAGRAILGPGGDVAAMCSSHPLGPLLLLLITFSLQEREHSFARMRPNPACECLSRLCALLVVLVSRKPGWYHRG